MEAELPTFIPPHNLYSPVSGDYVKDGASASKLAEDLMAMMLSVSTAISAEGERASFVRGNLGPSGTFTDPNQLPEGLVEVRSASDAGSSGLPANASGFIIRVIFGTTSTMYFFTSGGEIWSRFSNPTTWSEWKRTDGFAPDSKYARTDNVTYGGIVDFATAPARVYSVWNASDADVMNLPVRAAGQVYLGTSGSNFRTLLFITVTDPVQMWAARYTTATGFSEWKRVDSGAVAVNGGESPSSGFKTVALALSQQSSGGDEAISNDTIRWPIKYSVGAKRARLHIRNWNYYTGASFTGAVSFNGAWFGRSSGANFINPPANVLGPFTTPANGSEYVSPWFDVDLTEDVDHLLSVGYTTAAGQANAQSRSGCYRSGNASHAALASGFAGAISGTAPFDVWLEVEVPAETPVVAGFGDSNTVGTGTSLPVYDSWLSQYCRNATALPYFMAVHGTTSASWDDPTKPAWSHYEGTSKPDSVVYFLGQNDFQEGVSVSGVQANLAKVLAIVRQKLSQNVYLSTITPANNKSESVNSTRKSYNTWLKTKPHGVKDCFDFSVAVSDDDATIRPEHNADGVHFKTSGHTQMAAKLSERPVSPSVLTQSNIDALRALA